MSYKRVVNKKCVRCKERLGVENFVPASSKICNKCKETAQTERFCPACQTILLIENFRPIKDKVFAYCRDCERKKSVEYYSLKSQEQKGNRNRREWARRKDDPKYHEYRQKWLEENKEDQAAKNKKWREENRNIVIIWRTNQSAKARYNQPSVTMAEWSIVLELLGERCIACESDEYLSVDHVVPLSLGGENNVLNLQPLCLRCNMKKGARIVDFRTREFIESLNKRLSEQGLA